MEEPWRRSATFAVGFSASNFDLEHQRKGTLFVVVQPGKKVFVSSLAGYSITFSRKAIAQRGVKSVALV
jgi:hypothetical protein